MDAGDYRIIPFTTGSRLKKREADPSSSAKLLQNKDGKYTISRAFRYFLSTILNITKYTTKSKKRMYLVS